MIILAAVCQTETAMMKKLDFPFYQFIFRQYLCVGLTSKCRCLLCTGYSVSVTGRKLMRIDLVYNCGLTTPACLETSST